MSGPNYYPLTIHPGKHILTWKVLIFFLGFQFVFLSCSKDDERGESLPTTEAINKIDLSAGVRNSALKLSDGSDWQYRISIPPISQNEKVPLIINLHWAGSYNSYIESMQCLVEPAFSDYNYIIFSPRIPFGENWFDPVTRKRILTFIDLALTNWPVDKDRIAVTGYSLGGTGCWNYAASYPEYFSAAIPIAGAYISDEKIEIPLTVIHGTEDELYDYDLAISFLQESVDKGSEIQILTAEGLSHQQACNYMPYLTEAADWLALEVWN